jgi:hypothetical protein
LGLIAPQFNKKGRREKKIPSHSEITLQSLPTLPTRFTGGNAKLGWPVKGRAQINQNAGTESRSGVLEMDFGVRLNRVIQS